MTAENKTNRYGYRYTYYHCSKRRLDYRCQQPSVSVANLERQILGFLEGIKIPESLHNWAIHKLDRVAKDRTTLREAQRHSLEQTRVSLEREFENLTKLRIRDLLSDDEYVRERQELERKRLGTSQTIEQLERTSLWFEPAQMLISFNQRAVSWFKAGDLQTKRLILGTVGSNLMLKDRELSIDARKPFRPWSGSASISEMRAFVKEVRTLYDKQDSSLATVLAGVQELQKRPRTTAIINAA